MVKDGFTYCDYYGYGANSEEEFYYLESFYRSAYAYFVILFATDFEAEKEGRADFLRYAGSVSFVN